MVLNPTLRKYSKPIRYAEIAIVTILAAFAFSTYRELTVLRKFPVALPTYEFDIAGPPDPGSVVQTRGTWIAESGMPEPLQTTTIECRNSTMRCVESTAEVIFVSGKGLLDASLTQFEVDRWSDKEIVAKPRADRCATRTLVLDLVDKRARSRVSPNPGESQCKEGRDRNLELVAGYKVRADALK